MYPMYPVFSLPFPSCYKALQTDRLTKAAPSLEAVVHISVAPQQT